MADVQQAEEAAFELRLRRLFSAELERAERDFQPPPLGRPPRRAGARFVSEADTLAYDPGRRVVWIPVTQSVGPDYLYRYDPASGVTTRWMLPETTYQGVMAQVLVDESGAVWINDDGYRIVRFD